MSESKYDRKKNKDEKPRRTGAARALQHLIAGGEDMSDAQLEIALDQLLRRRK